MSSSSSSSLLIKGYLPVRVKLPSSITVAASSADDDNNFCDETFFYVKEHRDNTTNKDNNNKQNDTTTTAAAKGVKKGNHNNPTSATLFVANVPVLTGVRTKLVLQSLLGRFGDIARITVVPNPAKIARTKLQQHAAGWTSHFAPPCFLPASAAALEGKFAHVVFASPKEMKRTLQALTKIMSEEKATGATDMIGSPFPGLVLDKIEIQTLAHESDRLYRVEHGLDEEEEEEEDDGNNNNANEQQQQQSKQHSLTGVLAVAARYRASLQQLSRALLLQECNTVMEEFETADEKDRRAREAAANQPDADGFVTVTYSGSKRELEETDNTGTESGRRRKGQAKRTRNKKTKYGAQEQSNFYRFQTKEKRKESLQDLRRQFEDDLAKVKQMKEEKKYRPF